MYKVIIPIVIVIFIIIICIIVSVYLSTSGKETKQESDLEPESITTLPITTLPVTTLPPVKKARYIRLEQKVAPFCLNILWIKVYTRDSNGQDVLISKNKPATSRSVLNSDNYTFGTKNIHLYEPQNSIAHQGLYHSECVGVPEWIEIDLEQEYPVSRIQIGNRLECCKERIVNSEIIVSDTQKSEIWRMKITDIKDVYDFSIE